MQVASLHASNHVAYKGWHNLRCTSDVTRRHRLLLILQKWHIGLEGFCLELLFNDGLSCSLQISFHVFGKNTPPPKKKKHSSAKYGTPQFPLKIKKAILRFPAPTGGGSSVPSWASGCFQDSCMERIEFLPCLVTPFCIAFCFRSHWSKLCLINQQSSTPSRK